MILQPQKWRQFSLVEFFHPLADIMRQDKSKERALLGVEFGIDMNPCVRCSDFAGHRRQGVGDVGEDVEEVAFVGVDDALHFDQLIMAETFSGEGFKQLGAGVRGAPDGSQFGFVVEEFREFAEQHFHELLRRHRRAVGMPEAGHHHVLDVAGFAVGEFDLCPLLLLADALQLAADFARFFRAFARAFAAVGAGFRVWPFAAAGALAAGRTGFGVEWFAVPLRVAEVVISLHEVVDGEIVFAVVKSRASADDLFEFNHRVDWPQQDDVADVAGVHAR